MQIRFQNLMLPKTARNGTKFIMLGKVMFPSMETTAAARMCVLAGTT
jgi:hypothetical protein